MLIQAHATVDHGGRDKTSSEVRAKFSYIPKEIVSRFVSLCPGCDAHDRRDNKYFSTKTDGYYAVHESIRRLSIEAGHATEQSYASIDQYQPPLPPGMRYTPKKRVRKHGNVAANGTASSSTPPEDTSHDGGKVRTAASFNRTAAAPYFTKKGAALGASSSVHPPLYYAPTPLNASSIDLAQPPGIRRRISSGDSPTDPAQPKPSTSKAPAAATSTSLQSDYFSQPLTIVAPPKTPFDELPTPGYALGLPPSTGLPTPLTAGLFHPSMLEPAKASSHPLGLLTPYSSSFTGLPLPLPSPVPHLVPQPYSAPASQIDFLSTSMHSFLCLPSPSPVAPPNTAVDAHFVRGAPSDAHDQQQQGQTPNGSAPLAVPYQDAQGRVATNEKDLFDLLILGRKQPTCTAVSDQDLRFVEQTPVASSTESSQQTELDDGATMYLGADGLTSSLGLVLQPPEPSYNGTGSVLDEDVDAEGEIESESAPMFALADLVADTARSAAPSSDDVALVDHDQQPALPVFDITGAVASAPFEWGSFDGPFGLVHPSLPMTSTPPSAGQQVNDSVAASQPSLSTMAVEMVPELSESSSTLVNTWNETFPEPQTTGGLSTAAISAFFDWRGSGTTAPNDIFTMTAFAHPSGSVSAVKGVQTFEAGAGALGEDGLDDALLSAIAAACKSGVPV